MSDFDSEKIIEFRRKMSVDRMKHFPFLILILILIMIRKSSYFQVSITVHNNIKISFYKVIRSIYRQFSGEFKFFFQNQNRITLSVN